MATKPPKVTRFTDIAGEPIGRQPLSINGYENNSIVSLMQAIRTVSHLFERIEDCVDEALMNCRNPPEGLSSDESAAIYLYSMQLPTGPSLYTLLNQLLRAENRNESIPWFPYLKLFLTALQKLPSIKEYVWRGVPGINFSSKYPKGMKFPWSGVSSCTTDIGVLKSKTLLGNSGPRTLFSIECFNGKSIKKHSRFPSEQEVLLMPGSYFEVVGILPGGASNGLDIIQLKEISPPIIEPTHQLGHLRKILDKVSKRFNASNTLDSNSTFPISMFVVC